MILPEVLADLTDLFGDRVRRRFPESKIISQLGCSLLEVQDKSGVTTHEVAGILPQSWLEWCLGVEGGAALRF